MVEGRGDPFFPACDVVAKRKRKRRSRGMLLWIAIALLIIGFIVRRTLVPQLLHYLAYRPAESPSRPPEASLSPPDSSTAAPAGSSQAAAQSPVARKTPIAPSEHLTESDRQQLEDILKRKHR